MKRFIRNHRGMVVGAGLVGLALVVWALRRPALASGYKPAEA